MLKSVILQLLLLLGAATAFCQSANNDSKRDLQWPMISFSEYSTIHSILDFNFPPFSLSNYIANIKANRSYTSICDTAGNLLFISNGRVVLDKNGDTLPNGDSLGMGLYSQIYPECIFGANGTLILPFPGHDSLYLLFYFHLDDSSCLGSNENIKILYATISGSRNNGLGDVINKNIIIDDYSHAMGISALRHTNNRDWWLLFPQHGNGISRYLLNPEGIKYIGDQATGINAEMGPQVNFSPDGTKLAYFDYANPTPSGPSKYYLSISDIDRSTGLISNEQVISWDSPTSWMLGAAFSPNSRYYYISIGNDLLQFDLESNDILATKTTVASWDGFHWGPSPTNFWACRLAPDGKIYITTGSPYLHVIESPDMPGASCNVVQRAITLPFNKGFANTPNFPNYRIGNGVGLVEINALNTASISVFPNPANDLAHFEFKIDNNSGPLQFEIINMLGETIQSQYFAPYQAIVNMDVSGFSPGIYVAQLRDKKQVIGKVKFAVN